MIEEEFDSSSISSIQFGVSLFSGERYLVPIDKSVDAVFKDMLSRTGGSIITREGEWEEYSLSQDYSTVERVFVPRSDAIFKDISDLYEIEAFGPMANLIDNADQVDFYFVVYHDGQGRKIIGLRRAAQLKSMLAARRRLMQLINDTMVLIDHPVFRLDKDFDGLVCQDNIYFSNFLNMEYIAKITNKVAKAATQRIPTLAAKAAHLLASSKKGFSAHQLHRTLGVTYKTAWFMFHRLREAMRDGALAPMGGLDGPSGGAGIVEADETFIGREPGKPKKRAYHHKMKVLSLVDRDTKQVRSVVVDDLKPATVKPILAENIAKEASLYTDEAGHYVKLGADFIDHQFTSHGKDEYVRGIVHTNTVEGYFSVFKRGMKGIYQHCGKQHLHRYLAEFDFRYNNRTKLGVNDVARTERALSGIVGKRLTYRSVGQLV